MKFTLPIKEKRECSIQNKKHTTGTTMPQGKPQVQKGMRDQNAGLRRRSAQPVFLLCLRESALLDSTTESIPKVLAGQLFFIAHFL